MMIDTPGVGLSIGPCETSLTYPSSTVIQISSSGSGLHNFVFSALPRCALPERASGRVWDGPICVRKHLRLMKI